MITIEVNGLEYEGFTDITVTKSIDDLCGTFTFQTVQSDNINFPLKIGQVCKIYVEGYQVIGGYIEKMLLNYDGTTHTIAVSGRDKTADIVDSTLSDDSEFNGTITLETLAKNVLKLIGATNIGVITNNLDLPPFSASENLSDDAGSSAFDLLEKYAKMRQVLLTSNGEGDLVFTRSSFNKLNTILSLAKDAPALIKSCNVQYDNSKRFNKYICKSQDNDSSQAELYEKPVAIATNQEGRATDNEIRQSRVYNFLADNSGESVHLTDRAKWEANFRRSQGKIYNCTVVGFIPPDDTSLIWYPNYLVDVVDEFAGINNTLLISEVTYSQSLEDGSTVVLKLLTDDAFSLLVNKPEKKKKEQPMGEIYYEKQFEGTQ